MFAAAALAAWFLGGTPEPARAATPSTTTLVVSPAKSDCASEVAMRATVSPSDAGGLVQFKDGATVLGSRPLSGGVAVFTLAGLAIGSHALSAEYLGDGFNDPSTSDTIDHVVNRVASTAVLEAPASSECGGDVLLRVTVTPAGASGTVGFFDGATSLGSRPLSSGGTAELVIAGLAVGVHTLSAVYGGDGCHGPDTTNAVSHSVDRAPSDVQLAALDSSSCDVSLSLTATVTPVGATGTVEFFDGATSLAIRPVTPSGVVTIQVAGLAVGAHSLNSTYSGDGCHEPSSSSPRGHRVNTVPTSIVLDAPAKSDCGSTVLLTAIITPAGGTGTVEFLDGGTALAIRPVDPSGVVTASVPGLAAGSHSLSVSYGGDGCFEPSSSSPTPHQVNEVPSSIALSVGPAVTDCGEELSFQATVTPVGASGTVEFLDGATSLAIRPLDPSGVVSFTLAGLLPGAHSIQARYSGDECHPSSRSDTSVVQVLALPTSVSMESSTSKSSWGGSVELTATVRPSTAVGTVEFFDGDVAVSPGVNLVGGKATFAISTLEVGTHRLSARYNGGGCDGPSVSDTLLQAVNPAASSTSLASDVNPVKFGTPVTLTAIVGPAGVTGTVEFRDGVTVLDTVALDAGGSARLTTSSLAVGDRSLTAAYGGDPHFSGSVSAALVLQVLPDPPPVVRVDSPKGGEIWLVGTTQTILWLATDDQQVASVDLFYSRDLGASYDTIATGEPNDGEYAWRVPEPGTNTGRDPVMTALVRIEARDDRGNVGSGVSEYPFAVFDLMTGTLLALFQTEPVEEGLEVRWRLGDPGLFARVELERAESEGGPWSAVPVELRRHGDVTTALDRNVAPGRTYFYRLVAITPGGELMTFGPLSGTAAGPISDFALSPVAPNPSRGLARLEFIVAREADVRLSIVDVQGREVAVVLEGRYRPGRYQATWSGRTERGAAPAGLYFVRYQAEGMSFKARLVLTR